MDTTNVTYRLDRIQDELRSIDEDADAIIGLAQRKIGHARWGKAEKSYILQIEEQVFQHSKLFPGALSIIVGYTRATRWQLAKAAKESLRCYQYGFDLNWIQGQTAGEMVQEILKQSNGKSPCVPTKRRRIE